MTYTLYHYYEAEQGPFRNLSSLSIEEASKVSEQIRLEGRSFASQRSEEYMTIRRGLEEIARNQFINKGGKPKNRFPHYMTLGECRWLESWYKNPKMIAIDWNEFLEDSISFTYGDLFPTMRYPDNKPYRRKIFTKAEIVTLIAEWGLPQEWNKDGEKGPERYIEVQIWDEETINRFW
ncbi:hypothetical protein J4772_16105 [Cohnella sp. LGH]|uniref:Uncharacterized protein n=1 Tax=Cohnella phaseoli TaxID=456490 RepID=A0A3D9KIZ0_9BACL|nr:MULTISPECIES: hypothetical protein [Cohnella]QTH45807.1 hypothetical protein J4772_16105 [Cohnella sp. LGH]RED86501.1 hypothetical protein DFP98_103356 [Cohnella phaseoli]